MGGRPKGAFRELAEGSRVYRARVADGFEALREISNGDEDDIVALAAAICGIRNKTTARIAEIVEEVGDPRNNNVRNTIAILLSPLAHYSFNAVKAAGVKVEERNCGKNNFHH